MGRRKQTLENIEVKEPEEVKKSIRMSDFPEPQFKVTYFDENGNKTAEGIKIEGHVFHVSKGSAIIESPKPFFMDEVVAPTKEEKFDIVVTRTLSEIKELLIVKGKEYRRNNNPFHNFETGALITGQIPERVLNGFMMKHFISYNDILNDLEQGVLPTEKMVEEKFNDILVYFLLQKAMILNRIDESKA